jgi:aryl-alcohol dehydrogenase-like predicted oxidoreductase
MAMSGMYGVSDDRESIATIQLAYDSGISYFDTGDFYGMGHNEQLLRQALGGRPRDSYFVSVKFGAMRGPDGGFIGFDGRPPAVKNFLSYSLRRLGVDYIDLYQPSRIDPVVPVEETVGAISDMIRMGYVRYLGLSEASPDSIRRANAVHPVTALQIEYSLATRTIEAEILPAVRALGIGVVAYAILSRGLLTGAQPKAGDAFDLRKWLPRFQRENLDRNTTTVVRLSELAAARRITVGQLAAAWVLSRGNDIVPLAGARTRNQLRDLLGALTLSLSPNELAEIDRVMPPDAIAGDRYTAAQMAMLDSERRVPGSSSASS